MGLAERENNGVLGHRGLEFEVELAAEALAESEAPGAVDAAAERAVHDQLLAAGLVEETLQHQRVLGRQHAEHALGGGQIVGELACGTVVEMQLAHQPLDRRRQRVRVDMGKTRVEPGAQPCHRRRQFVGARRRLADPERDVGRRTTRVLDPHLAALDLEHAVGGVAELEDVAGHRLDREVLVDRADEGAGRLQHHPVVGVVGDGAAGGERGQARALAPAQPAVDRIAVQVGGAPPAAGGVALAQHVYHGVELGARQLPVHPGAPHQFEQLVLAVLAVRDLGDNLLRQHVERFRRDDQPVELAAAHGIEQRRALDQVVARLREQTALGDAADAVVGAPDPLQEGGDGVRRAQLADQVDIADVDAELERGGGDQHPQAAGLEALLGVEPDLL